MQNFKIFKCAEKQFSVGYFLLLHGGSCLLLEQQQQQIKS